LDQIQNNSDQVQPDEVSKKSLKFLNKNLQMLAQHAEFGVNINSVLGSGINHPHDALTVANRAVELGFTSTLGIIHDGTGQLRPLSELEQSIYRKIKDLGKRSYARFDKFQKNIVEAQPNHWRCRAGARYLYICENGLVHYCSQQRGYPAIPLKDYSRQYLRREFNTRKSCAPLCTVSCVQQVAMLDNWRLPQTLSPQAAGNSTLVQLQTQPRKETQVFAK